MVTGIESAALLATQQIAGKALYAHIDKVMGLLFDAAPSFIKDTYKKGGMIIDKGLPSYLAAHYSKCETVRTLLRRDTPVVLDSVYVKPKFSIGTQQLESDEVLRLSQAEGSPIIITGTAGSGKSVFLKWSFREVIKRGYTYYPVFFEIRSMPESTTGNLLDMIYESIARYVDGFTRAQFNFGLKRGLFYLMIDALDEAPIVFRDSIEKEIMEIARKYRKCPLILTSRPSNDLKVWEGFTETHLLPFDRGGCLEYISKIDFDQARKEDFKSALSEEFFNKHKEFLSNALLASMMLLTFDEFGEIPERRHIFYQKCFDVLIREHDHSKGKFRRQLVSSLDHSQVERIFQAFCVLSFLDVKYVFTSSSFFQYLRDAMDFCGIEADATSVGDDFCHSVSIIQRDGDHFEFVHRSFQEYFYARFCVSDRTHPLLEKGMEIASRSDARGLLDMISDMDRDQFDSDLVLPAIQGILSKLKHIDALEKPDMVMKLFCDGVSISSSPKDEDYFSFYILREGGAVGRNSKALNSYLLFYVSKNSKNDEIKIDWPEPLSVDDFRSKLRDFGLNEDELGGVEISLIHSKRELLKAFGVGELSASIVESFSKEANTLIEGKRIRSNSLSSRMRTKDPATR